MSFVAKLLPFQPTTEYLIGVFIGTVAVMLFCFASFNKPAEEYSASEHEALFLPREQTGHIQYLFGFGLYLVAFVTGYLMLCAIGPGIGYALLSLIPTLSNNDLNQAKVAENFPIYIALFLIGVAPGYEKLNIPERSFRKAIHRRASIPTALRSLVRRLREDEISPASFSQIPDDYLVPTYNLGLDAQRKIDPQFAELWNRLAFIYYRYKHRRSTFDAFFSDEFLARHTRVADQITKDFVSLHRAVKERDKKLVDINDTAPDSELYTRTEDLYKKLCYLVAGLIIQECGLSTRRYQALERIGYVQSPLPSGSSTGVLVVGFIILGVFASIMVFAAEERPLKYLASVLVGGDGEWPSSIQSFFYVIPFMLRQFFMVTLVFWMYSKKMYAARPEDDVLKRLGPSLAAALPICIVGATLAQLVYYIWATGLQLKSPTMGNYTALLPYWLESMVSGTLIWIMFYVVHRMPARTGLFACFQVVCLGMLYGIVMAGLGYLAMRTSGHLFRVLVDPESTGGNTGFYMLVAFILGSLIGLIAFATAYAEWGLARARSGHVYEG